VDVFETGTTLWILAALPGVAPEQISIVFDGGTLIITGERNLPGELRAARIHRFEIPHGRFERRVDLPPGHYEVNRRELVNGCLLLSLQKAP
jgi:HSP20 family protein